MQISFKVAPFTFSQYFWEDPYCRNITWQFLSRTAAVAFPQCVWARYSWRLSSVKIQGDQRWSGGEPPYSIWILKIKLINIFKMQNNFCSFTRTCSWRTLDENLAFKGAFDCRSRIAISCVNDNKTIILFVEQALDSWAFSFFFFLSWSFAPSRIKSIHRDMPIGKTNVIA